MRRWAKRIGLAAVGLIVVLSVLFLTGRLLIDRIETESDPHALTPWGPGTFFLATSAGETHVLDVGEGDAILLIHGSTGSIADSVPS